MPHLDSAADSGEPVFPPVTKDHILNCSYDAWFPKYQDSCFESRIIPLSPDVVSYLQEDGILSADDEDDSVEETQWHAATVATVVLGSRDGDMSDCSSDDSEHLEARLPPNKRFLETHERIKNTIANLGGAVAPKLNWSSPKDAKWMSRHQNTLKCTSPNDIYQLLKASSFVSHDLEHAFDGCTAAPASRPLRHVLVLRPFFRPQTALEFRCFVRHRWLVGISQRDSIQYAFLANLRPQIVSMVQAFFRDRLRLTFPDASFVFDVYISEKAEAENGLGSVRLMDINPWAPRTDSLLFAWEELLGIEVAQPLFGPCEGVANADKLELEDEEGRQSGVAEPELRLVGGQTAAAFYFSSAQYSTHRMPLEAVKASLAGGSELVAFARQWRALTEAADGQQRTIRRRGGGGDAG